MARIAMGLNGLADWSSAQPFIDVMKCSRSWFGHGAGWGDVRLTRANSLDADGWPTRLPAGCRAAATVLLTEIKAADTALSGRYRLMWEGQGTINVSGNVRSVTRSASHLEFDHTPNGGGLVEVSVSALDVANPIRNIRCVHTRHLAAYQAGEIFRPEWLALLTGGLQSVRFMDWQETNSSKQSTWESRTPVTAATWTTGAPVEVMVALANKIQTSPWFCIPHQATDDYIRRFAQYVRQNLRPELVANFEFSNEVWNWGAAFNQSQYARQQAINLGWGDGGDQWMQWYGGRAAEMAIILNDVFSGETNRVRKILGTQTGYRGLEWPILNAPRWVAARAGRQAPYRYFDAYAVTGYFDGRVGEAARLRTVQDWRRQHGDEGAMQRLYEQILDGRHMGVGSTINQMSEIFGYHKRIADQHGLSLVMYEGGTHIVPDGGVLNSDPTLMPFLERFHYSDHMARLYERAIEEFGKAGGEAFNIFVECARPSQHGFWGMQRHAGDETPRSRAVRAFLTGAAPAPAPTPSPTPEPAPAPEPAPQPTPIPAPAATRRQPSTPAMINVQNGHSLTDEYVNSGFGVWPGNIVSLFEGQFGSGVYKWRPDTHTKDTIPGSPLHLRWNNGCLAKSEPQNFDTLVTTETVPPARPTPQAKTAANNTLDYLVRFAENHVARGKGRKEVILWATWPHKDGAPGFGGFRDAAVEYGRCFRFFAEYATWKVRRRNPNLPANWRVWVIPGYAWWVRFHDDVRAGRVPGISDYRALFKDDIHLTEVGSWAMSLLVHTCLYQSDTRQISYRPPAGRVSTALDDYFRRIAWEVANQEACIGMGGTANAAASFDPAVYGDPLDPSYVHRPDPAPEPTPEPEPEPTPDPKPVDPTPEPVPDPKPVDPTPQPDPKPAEPKELPQEAKDLLAAMERLLRKLFP